MEIENIKVLNGIRVENMTSESTGREIPNQFIIKTDNETIFQSYRTIICVRKGGKIYLDARKWDYSNTTGKYRNQFLGESIKETREKIKKGVYILANLNG